MQNSINKWRSAQRVCPSQAATHSLWHVRLLGELAVVAVAPQQRVAVRVQLYCTPQLSARSTQLLAQLQGSHGWWGLLGFGHRGSRLGMLARVEWHLWRQKECTFRSSPWGTCQYLPAC